MTTIVSIDPGRATGVAWGFFGKEYAYERTRTAVWTQEDVYGYWHAGELYADILVVEDFRLRSGNRFTADLTGVEIIGFLKGVAGNLVLQQPTDKALVPDRILKQHGLWLTGKDVDWEDARDVMDSTIHALAYLLKQKHRPTIDKYFTED